MPYWTSHSVYGYASEAWTVGMNAYLGGWLGINGKTVDDHSVWALGGGTPKAAAGDLNLGGTINLGGAVIALAGDGGNLRRWPSSDELC